MEQIVSLKMLNKICQWIIPIIKMFWSYWKKGIKLKRLLFTKMEMVLGRIQNYKNWSPHMVADPSRTSLGLEYFLWDQDEEWTWQRERLIEHGIKDCAELGLIEPQEVEDGTVVRMPKAYPVYDQTYQDSLATVRNYLRGLSNLQLIGRNGQHRYNNQDHSMLAGVYAARNLAGARYDVWSVNTEREYHEEGAEPSALEPGAIVTDRSVPIALPELARRRVSAEQNIAAAFSRIDPVALGAAFGVVAALGMALGTAVALLRGGSHLRTYLIYLAANYFPGFRVTWARAALGTMEAGAWGFGLGYLGAVLRNQGLAAYAFLLGRGES